MPDTTPTLAGFLTFCRTVVGIPIAAMPDADPGFATALAFAQEWIPDQIATYSPTLSTSAVYNWAASSIIQFQPDITGQVYFQGLRKSFGVTNFVPGVITTASNEATSDSVTVVRDAAVSEGYGRRTEVPRPGPTDDPWGPTAGASAGGAGAGART